MLIASGYSGRMGRLKPLLDIGGASFITGIVLKLTPVCGKIVIVLGHEKNQIEDRLHEEIRSMESSSSSVLSSAAKQAARKLEIICNENYEMGMFTSLQKGINQAADYSWVLYHFADQPALPKSFYFEFAEKINTDCKWIQPVNGGKSGHPLLLSDSIIDNIKTADKNDNLRNLLAGFKEKRCAWECPYPEILDDIDTIEEYNKIINGGYKIMDDLMS